MRSQGGLEGRNDTQGEERGKKDGGRLQREREKKDKIAEGIWNLSLPFCIAPSDPLPPHSLSSCSKSFLSVFYKSWCLFLRELLRVVTVLEVSSASSSSFTSRTSPKNLKMELKLIQEVSSCLSVPTCKRHTQTNTKITMSRVHKIFASVKPQAKKVYGEYSDIIKNIALHLLLQHKK